MTTSYHDHPAVSATRLKRAITGTERSFRRPFKRTDAMRQGSLVDCLALTPGRFDTTYLVRPEGLDLRTKAGKEWQAEHAASELETIPHDWHTTALAIVAALRSDRTIADLLDLASQQPHYWHDAAGIPCRYMPDMEAPGLLVDMKKTASAAPRQFAAQAYSLAYDVQLAHYLLGHVNRYELASLPRVGFLAYEWDPMPDVGLYWLPGEWLEEGLRRREIAMDRLLLWETQPSNESHPEQTLPLPRWAGVDDHPQLDPEHF
jgi:PDDEXK-like domain of unknown function (DUF3799)